MGRAEELAGGVVVQVQPLRRDDDHYLQARPGGGRLDGAGLSGQSPPVSRSQRAGSHLPGVHPASP